MGYGLWHDVSGVSRLGSRDHSWDMCAFSLVLLPYMQKVRNVNCERGCEGNIDSEEVVSKWLKGGSPYKHAWVHDNFKSEHLPL